MTEYPYGVVIFVSRESPERALRTIVDTANAALAGTLIEVLVNGNAELAAAIKGRFDELPLPSEGKLRLWNIELGDKANAWNQYLHQIWSEQVLVWFIDGYVSPQSQAFQSMRAGMERNDEALGASGVPSNGRTAARLRNQMFEEGGFHGNLCCLRGAVIHRIACADIRLPLGTYWVDGLVGSLLHFNLDPSAFEQDFGRVWVDPDATWTTEPDSSFTPAKWHRSFQRMRRQARGKVENAALSDFLHRQGKLPANLPGTAGELVAEWARERPASLLSVLNLNPLRWAAFRRLLAPSAGKHLPGEAMLLQERASG